MTIPFRVSLVIDMKRLLLVFLTLLLCLPLFACNKEEQNVFVLQNGGYTDSETGIWYSGLPYAFEPVKSSAERGVALHADGQVKYTFLEIPDLDSKQWLCDDMRGVWYAGEFTVQPSTLTPRALLINEELSFSLERARLAIGQDDALIAEILTLWFTGEGVEEPIGEVTLSRRLRLISEELPSIYYCFDFYVCDGRGYFYDRVEARYVAVPESLSERLAAY